MLLLVLLFSAIVTVVVVSESFPEPCREIKRFKIRETTAVTEINKDTWEGS